MRIDGPFIPNLPAVREGETSQKNGAVTKFDRDTLEIFKEASLPQADQAESTEGTNAQPAPAASDAGAEEDDGFKFTDILPFGIGYWFDDEGTFATDFGKTLLSIIIPIPFLGGLIAGELGPHLGNAIFDVGEWGFGAVKDIAEWTGGAIEDTAGFFGDAAGDALDAVGSAAGDVVDAIGGAAEDIGDFIGGLF